jgi:acetyl-CoA C-acetyltransferase
MAGQTDLMVAGGVEHMSRVPMMSSGGAWAVDPEVAIPTAFVPQGISADLIATKWRYSRTDVDSFAVRSQTKAAAAWAAGHFDRSVVPVVDEAAGITVLSKDEHLRPSTTVESLSGLKPSFAVLARAAGFDGVVKQRYPEVGPLNHVHHAGNSSGIVDGAAAVLIGNHAAGQRAGLTPRARIRAFAAIGSEPTIMLTGPSYAAEKALKRAGMVADDIDLWEVNEAFASVVLRFMEAMGIDETDVNPNGGAIALGHPLGATGAVLLGTALDELERQDRSTALIKLCVGAGMGVATIIERV